MERRIEDRIETHVQLTCRVPATPSRAVLRDLSHLGCKLDICGVPVKPGATAMIDLPTGQRVSGLVVWVHGNQAGIRFHRRLTKGASIALGLEEPEPEPVDVAIQPLATSGGLRHWFRKLTVSLLG